jgi:hypothetical protein
MGFRTVKDIIEFLDKFGSCKVEFQRHTHHTAYYNLLKDKQAYSIWGITDKNSDLKRSMTCQELYDQLVTLNVEKLILIQES